MSDHSYGGFWVRVIAYLVDSVIVVTLLFLVVGGLAFAGDAGAFLITLAVYLVPLLYFVLMQSSARQATLGKQLLGLKVATVDGERISLLRSLGREVAKIASAIPLCIGFLLAAFTSRKQALHDMVVSTTVTREGGSVILGLLVALFGWVAPAAVIMVLGMGILAAMMGSMGGAMFEQAMQDAQKQSAAAQPAPPRKAAPGQPGAQPGATPKPGARGTTTFIQIPHGVRYKYATDEVNRQAEVELLKSFGSGADSAVIGSRVIIGPSLWRTLATDTGLARIEKGAVAFKVPTRDASGNVIRTREFQGKLIQSPQDAQTLYRALAAMTGGKPLNVRKLRPAELSYYWALISWDIEEPVFALETGTTTLLLQLGPDRKLMYVDQLGVEAPESASGFKLERIHLYQPDKELSPRLGGDPRALGEYIKAIERRFAEAGNSLKGTPRTFSIVVVVKPGGASRSWLISGPGQDVEIEALYRAIAPEIRNIPAPQPRGGPIGFVLSFAVHGGRLDPENIMPIPPSWAQVGRAEKPATFDDMVRAVWPDSDALVAKTANPVATPASVQERSNASGPIQTRAIGAPSAPGGAPDPEPVGLKYNDLMTAVLKGDAGAVSELLALGKWPDKPDSRGLTPLAAAAYTGDAKVAEVLLKAGARPDAALAVARERRDAAMVSLLEKYRK